MDIKLSALYAQTAINTVMAGYTGCFIGTMNKNFVVIPLSELIPI